MLPKQPIAVPQDAFDAAAALRTRLDAAAGRYTVGVGLKQTGGEFTDQIALFVYVQEKSPRVRSRKLSWYPQSSAATLRM
jgi:hypothetical protein